MSRAPFQVLVIPYNILKDTIRYCIFERTQPMFQVQFIAGGGEDDETPIEAAERECFEEAQIQSGNFIKLTSLCYIPTHIFSENQRKIWGEDVFVIPEHAFAVELKSADIVISEEHTWYKWVSYEEALSSLKWDSNKTALYELNCRIKLHLDHN